MNEIKKKGISKDAWFSTMISPFKYSLLFVSLQVLLSNKHHLHTKVHTHDRSLLSR